jgi:hypothetical protein
MKAEENVSAGGKDENWKYQTSRVAGVRKIFTWDDIGNNSATPQISIQCG